MLAMGRAMMSDPRYLLLDEPSLGLAPKLVEQIRDVIVRDQRGRAPASCWSSRTPPWRCRSPTTATSWRPAGSCSTSRPASCSRDDDVREFYLGLHPGEDGASRSATSSTTGAGSGGRHERRPAPGRALRRRPPLLRGRQGDRRASASRSARRAVRDHRPQRRRQDLASSTCCPASTGRSTGRVEFLGESILGRRPHRIAARGLARTFQNIALFEHLTVLDNLMLGRHQHLALRLRSPAFAWLRPGPAARSSRTARVVEEIVDFLELEQWRTLPVGLLPYGVQKRVELGRALAMEPKLLLLDEPVAGHEPRGDRGHRPLHPRHPRRAATSRSSWSSTTWAWSWTSPTGCMVVDFGMPIATGIPAEVQRHPDVVRAYLGEVSTNDRIATRRECRRRTTTHRSRPGSGTGRRPCRRRSPCATRTSASGRR